MLRCMGTMRTTIRIDDQLLARAKGVAAASRRTLTQVIEDALRESLARRPAAGPREPFRMLGYKGSGLQPGINLDDSAALRDSLDEA